MLTCPSSSNNFMASSLHANAVNLSHPVDYADTPLNMINKIPPKFHRLGGIFA